MNPKEYPPGYYAAFVLDPDGSNIETASVMDEIDLKAWKAGKRTALSTAGQREGDLLHD